MRVDFETEDEDLSPMMDVQNATFVLGRNKINNPISDYTSDSRSNGLDDDPHGSVFVTKGVGLLQPATSLKVIIAAHRQEDADFRVFYRLNKVDSSGVDQKFVPFPGYDNLLDTDGDGFGDQLLIPIRIVEEQMHTFHLIQTLRMHILSISSLLIIWINLMDLQLRLLCPRQMNQHQLK